MSPISIIEEEGGGGWGEAEEEKETFPLVSL